MSVPAKIRKVFQNARCLFTKPEIETALDKMALEISQSLSEETPILLTVLKGGIPLTASLLQRLDFPLEIDNIHATRYRDKFQGGEMQWYYEPRADLKDRVVLILDDILDRGITLQGIVDYCVKMGAKKVLTGVLLEKTIQRPENGLQKADFAALHTEDYFVFGYGLDYKEYLRNAPGIYEVAQEDQV